MWAFVVLGVIFALIGYLGSYSTLLIILFVLAVVAHVAGNVLGTQLRNNGDTPLGADGYKTGRRIRVRKATPADFAPVTRLGDHSSLGRPIVIVTCAGTVLGAVAGGAGLFLLVHEELSVSTIGSITLGMLAAGVLGAIWTFLAASFLQVACSALRQATREAKKRSP